MYIGPAGIQGDSVLIYLSIIDEERELCCFVAEADGWSYTPPPPNLLSLWVLQKKNKKIKKGISFIFCS